MANDVQLAEEIRDYLRQNSKAEVDDLADLLGEPHGRVAQILDEYHVIDTGKVEHRGPGNGGGWVPKPE